MKHFDFNYFLPVLKNLKNILIEKKFTISTAESCTGGLLAGIITSIPGSSSFFQGSFVVYSNFQKINLLHVDEKILENFGAVSENCAVEMAKKVKNLTGTDVSISTTGIAGPDGGTPEKPVGTVYSTIIINDFLKTYRYNFNGSRNYIRVKTVDATLNNLMNLLWDLKL